ncbi:hypothetical protein AK812_SmicGene43778 [Symbiodinium microadriaticum]|uniref:Uncharacterized protein n=1 Tax=Symbiodinium microadriaticum TaxID=2951 RepID=A0A1Q9C057_SYMMI|nr:hypothetical protein AK812_SmicGene43778 [Symbiodinium microadriaticum]
MDWPVASDNSELVHHGEQAPSKRLLDLGDVFWLEMLRVFFPDAAAVRDFWKKMTTNTQDPDVEALFNIFRVAWGLTAGPEDVPRPDDDPAEEAEAPGADDEDDGDGDDMPPPPAPKKPRKGDPTPEEELAEDANDETVEGGESENDLANDECIDVHPLPSLDMLLPPGPVDPSNVDTLVMETPSPSPPRPKRTLQDDQATLDQMIAEMEEKIRNKKQRVNPDVDRNEHKAVIPTNGPTLCRQGAQAFTPTKEDQKDGAADHAEPGQPEKETMREGSKGTGRNDPQNEGLVSNEQGKGILQDSNQNGNKNDGQKGGEGILKGNKEEGDNHELDSVPEEEAMESRANFLTRAQQHHHAKRTHGEGKGRGRKTGRGGKPGRGKGSGEVVGRGRGRGRGRGKKGATKETKPEPDAAHEQEEEEEEEEADDNDDMPVLKKPAAKISNKGPKAKAVPKTKAKAKATMKKPSRKTQRGEIEVYNGYTYTEVVFHTGIRGADMSQLLEVIYATVYWAA